MWAIIKCHPFILRHAYGFVTLIVCISIPLLLHLQRWQRNFHQVTINGSVSHVYVPNTFEASDIFFDVVFVWQDARQITATTGANSSVHFIGWRYFRWPSPDFDCVFHKSGQRVAGFFQNMGNTHIALCPVFDGHPITHITLYKKNSSELLHPNFDNVRVSTPPSRPRYYLTAYTMIKNVCAQLEEWLEYHSLVGFEHFFLYDNNSTDCSQGVLERYIRNNVVTIVHWPFQPIPGTHWNSVQSASMRHALKTFGPYSEWMGYFDVDEYFQYNTAVTNNSLIETLQQPSNSQLAALRIEMWTASCKPSQELILNRRHAMLFECCRFLRRGGPLKMFIRPIQVPTMQNIHDLDVPAKKEEKRWEVFGRFRHYHYGGDFNDSDSSLDMYIPLLKKALID